MKGASNCSSAQSISPRVITRADGALVGILAQDAATAQRIAVSPTQFNLLEMVTPEQGVTRYKDDPTQGPNATWAGF